MGITPVILTHNEELNIVSSLASLRTFPRVVVLDSGSTDRTEEISRSFGNVSWFQRKFDSHQQQWQFAVTQTNISSEFVLALDADMRVTEALRQELTQFVQERHFMGGWVSFEYWVFGRRLMGSIYPPQIRVFRPASVRIDQLGHTQVFHSNDPLCRFRGRLIHEDRKPLDRWMSSQFRYASLEFDRLRSSTKRTLKDNLRIWGLSPAIWSMYSYIRAGGLLNPRAARAYAYERLIFEAILARMLAESAESNKK